MQNDEGMTDRKVWKESDSQWGNEERWKQKQLFGANALGVMVMETTAEITRSLVKEIWSGTTENIKLFTQKKIGIVVRKNKIHTDVKENQEIKKTVEIEKEFKENKLYL